MLKLPYPMKDLTNIKIVITEGLTEDGEQNVIKEIITKCTINERVKYVRDADGKLITLEGSLYIKGDILPGIGNIEGKVILENNKTYNIYKVSKYRNPDASVHHTKLELI